MQIDLFPHLVPADEPPITQARVLELLRPLLPELFAVCGDALADANRCTVDSAKRGVTHTGLTRTLELHDGIASFIRKEWGEDERFHLIDRKPFSIVVNGTLSLSFKKLSRGRLEFNKTEASFARLRQCKELPQIVVGVALSPAEDRVTSFHVVCMRDEDERWWTEIVTEPEDGVVPLSGSSTSSDSDPSKPKKARKFRGKKKDAKTKRDRDQES